MPMLSELTISNFAIIDRLNLTFGPGFNVLSGETGAGKSIIIDAVSMLLGGRADATLIRSGTEEAYIEGVFHLSPATLQRLAPLLAEYGLESDGEIIVLSRQIRRSGRNICRVNGRAVPLSVLERIGENLVDIHGQSEHLSLLKVRSHLHFIDRYAGLEAQREAFAERVSRLRQVRQDLRALLQDERELARRVDLLTYQLGEIESAQLVPGEEEELEVERTRLANAERLAELAAAAYQLLGEGGEEQRSAVDAVGEALEHLNTALRIDSTLQGLIQSTEAVFYQLEDLTRSVREYWEGIEYDPERLRQLEDRLELIRQLKRKYGATIEEVLAYAEQVREELDTITHSEERIAELQEEERRLLLEIGEAGAALSTARRKAARNLEKEIEAHLADLKMERSRFVVNFTWAEDPEGAIVGTKRYAFSATGLDRIEFLISPNVGEEPKPLVKIASGGETSRLMLAMKSVLSAADPVPTLIFDEVDSGIGGRVASIVGRKLWELTAKREHQVLCVTHLPQMACYADEHFRVEKTIVADRTVTVVQRLDEQSRREELALMMGGTTSAVARRNVEEMLNKIQKTKEAYRDQS